LHYTYFLIIEILVFQDLREEENNAEGNDVINNRDSDEVEFPRNSDIESSTESGSGTFSSQSETEVEDGSQNGETEEDMENQNMLVKFHSFIYLLNVLVLNHGRLLAGFFNIVNI
jgi:hypothetical protein